MTLLTMSGTYTSDWSIREAEFLRELVLQNTTTTMEAILPCNNIPFSPNPHFSGRRRELEAIEEELGLLKAKEEFRGFALYGTGGMGKTQTALAYAYKQVADGVSVVLWLNCETRLSMARSFHEIAKMLKFPGLSQNEHSDQNQYLVLDWIRRTRMFISLT